MGDKSRPRWRVIRDDSGDRDGYWLRREGYLETFLPTEDLASIEALIRHARERREKDAAPGQPPRKGRL